jgi:hypothetical protein
MARPAVPFALVENEGGNHVMSLTYESRKTEAAAPENERRHYGIMIETLLAQDRSEDEIVQAIEEATAEETPD